MAAEQRPDQLLHSPPVFATTGWLLRPLLEELGASDAWRKEKQGSEEINGTGLS